MEVIDNSTGGKSLSLLGDQKLRPATVLVDCELNETIYPVLGLEAVFDVRDVQTRLDKFDLLKTMEGLRVSISDVGVFSAESEALADYFVTSLSADFSVYLPQLSVRFCVPCDSSCYLTLFWWPSAIEV